MKYFNWPKCSQQSKKIWKVNFPVQGAACVSKNMFHLFIGQVTVLEFAKGSANVRWKGVRPVFCHRFIDYWNCFSSSPVSWIKTTVWGITKRSECSSAGVLTTLLSLHWLLSINCGNSLKRKISVCFIWEFNNRQFIYKWHHWKPLSNSLQPLL